MAQQDTPTPVVVEFSSDCTIRTLLNLFPCLDCLSESQLEMILLYLWADLWSLEDNIHGILMDSTDGQNISRKQLLIAEVGMMANALLARGITVQSVIDNVKCLPCAQPSLVRAAILKLKCQFWRLLA